MTAYDDWRTGSGRWADDLDAYWHSPDDDDTSDAAIKDGE